MLQAFGALEFYARSRFKAQAVNSFKPHFIWVRRTLERAPTYLKRDRSSALCISSVGGFGRRIQIIFGLEPCQNRSRRGSVTPNGIVEIVRMPLP